MKRRCDHRQETPTCGVAEASGSPYWNPRSSALPPRTVAKVHKHGAESATRNCRPGKVVSVVVISISCISSLGLTSKLRPQTKGGPETQGIYASRLLSCQSLHSCTALTHRQEDASRDNYASLSRLGFSTWGEYRVPYPSGHLKSADDFEDDDCKALHAWQTQSFPTCNHVHELDLSTMANREGELVGRGTWRETWKWSMEEDMEGVRYVALKTMRMKEDLTPRNFDRHRRDALAYERLTWSPYVVDMYSYCGNTGTFEFGGFGNLADIMGAKKDKVNPAMFRRMSGIQRLHIAVHVTKGVADMHNSERDGRPAIVHGDLGLDQIIFVDGVFKVNDFNRGRFMRRNVTDDRPCGFRVGRNPGKFRSPEECRLDVQTEKIDVYDVGNVLYVLLTGKYPFEGMKSKEAQSLIIAGKRPMIPGEIANSTAPEDQAMLKAVKMCFVHDPNERVPASDVAEFLSVEFDRLSELQRF